MRTKRRTESDKKKSVTRDMESSSGCPHLMVLPHLMCVGEVCDRLSELLSNIINTLVLSTKTRVMVVYPSKSYRTVHSLLTQTKCTFKRNLLYH